MEEKYVAAGTDYRPYLVQGNVYRLLEEDEVYCTIIDETGARATYFKHRFVDYKKPKEEPVKETKMEKQKMKFKYYDLLDYSTDQPTAETNLFFPLFCLNGVPGDRLSDRPDMVGQGWSMFDYIYGTFYSISSGIWSINALNGGRYAFDSARALRIKGDARQISGVVKIAKHVISIKPNDEAKKAIKQFLDVLKPKGEVYIGQLYLTPNHGFKGLSLYCNNSVITYITPTGETIRIDLAPGTDYKTQLELFLGVGDAAEFNKKNYPNLVKASVSKVKDYVFVNLQNNLRDLEANKESYAKELAKLTKKFVGLDKAVKVYKDRKADIPKELLYLCEQAKKDHAALKTSYETYKANYLLSQKAHQEAKDSLAYAKKSIDSAGDDFAKVRKLLKTGFIESIGYNKTDGLHWVYPPMTYKYGEADNAVCFLGRVKVAINNKPDGHPVKLWAISYPIGDGYVYGTWHFQNHNAGLGVCLGQFTEIINNLLASGKISNLIVVMKDYIQSKNEQSKRVSTVNFERMSISGPKVVDDSFTVWVKKQNEGKEITVA